MQKQDSTIIPRFYRGEIMFMPDTYRQVHFIRRVFCSNLKGAFLVFAD